MNRRSPCRPLMRTSHTLATRGACDPSVGLVLACQVSEKFCGSCGCSLCTVWVKQSCTPSGDESPLEYRIRLAFACLGQLRVSLNVDNTCIEARDRLFRLFCRLVLGTSPT